MFIIIACVFLCALLCFALYLRAAVRTHTHALTHTHVIAACKCGLLRPYGARMGDFAATRLSINNNK